MNFWWFKKKDKPKPLSRYEQIKRKIELIRMDRINQVHSPNMSSIRLWSVFRTFAELNSSFRNFIRVLENPALSISHYSRIPGQEVYLSDMFVDQQGCYEDSETLINLFTERLQEFLTLYEVCELSPDAEKYEETLRTLAPFVLYFDNLIDLLVEVTFEGDPL